MLSYSFAAKCVKVLVAAALVAIGAFALTSGMITFVHHHWYSQSWRSHEAKEMAEAVIIGAIAAICAILMIVSLITEVISNRMERARKEASRNKLDVSDSRSKPIEESN